MTRFIAATGNANKLKEFRRILEPLGIEVVSPGDVGADLEVEETGETFAENAYLKARAYFLRTGIPSIADDSGLCVDALDGRPGIHSARYHGDAPYSEKCAEILRELGDTPQERRTARFCCAICCVAGEDKVLECESVCEGFIGYEQRGKNGFGYNPVFYIGERSMAELSDAEKDEVSHRGKALRTFAEKLGPFLGGESL